jgi:hypothetical protein
MGRNQRVGLRACIAVALGIIVIWGIPWGGASSGAALGEGSVLQSGTRPRVADRRILGLFSSDISSDLKAI